MFSMSSAAAKQVQQSAAAGAAQHLALRVAARREADGSIQYGMGFDEPGEDDLKLDLQGVAVVIGPDHQAMLDQILLDFVEMEPGTFNFIFVNDDHAPETSSGGGCH